VSSGLAAPGGNVITHGLAITLWINSTAIVHGGSLNEPPVMQRWFIQSFCRRILLYQKRLATLQLHSLYNLFGFIGFAICKNFLRTT
jgi:hypothetical protein